MINVKMQGLFIGILGAIALGVTLFKSILFVVHLVNLKKSNEIIRENQAHNAASNKTQQLVQKTMFVQDWLVSDPHLRSEDLRQQFLMKSRMTSRSMMPSRERMMIPLATTDLDEEGPEEGTQV